jgi:cytochrome c-type biogenesis protein CcmE
MQETTDTKTDSSSRMKFIIGGLLIVAAVIYLIYSSTTANAQYYLTVDEVAMKEAQVYDRELRISGAVIGESIDYDPQTLTLKFTVAHIPGDNDEIEKQGGLAVVLHEAVVNPSTTLEIEHNGPMPDLLQDEAQAIMTGHLGQDGVFYADELLLKCPTKYEEAVPDQVEG